MRAIAFIPVLFAATSFAATLNAPRGFEVVVRSDSAKIGTIEQRADRKGTVSTDNHPRDLETRADRKGTVHTGTPSQKRDDDSDIVARGKGGGGGKGDLDIAQFVIEFATGLFDQLKELSQEKDKENKFVDTMLDKTAAKYPNKNVLIFHNQASQLVDFTGSTHEHVELPLAFQRTKGYEILVFDTGRFKLAGDGGYLNVGYLGVWEKKDGWVVFKKR